MWNDGRHLQEDLLNASWLPTDPSTSSSAGCPSKPTYSRTNLRSYSQNKDLNKYIYSAGGKNLHMIQFDRDRYVKHNRRRKVCCCWTVFSRSREITKTTQNVKVMQDSVIFIDIWYLKHIFRLLNSFCIEKKILHEIIFACQWILDKYK